MIHLDIIRCMEKTGPDYKKIFNDIISDRFPERRNEFEHYLAKKKLSVIEIITINNKLFDVSTKDSFKFNQRHKSYDKEAVIMILDYQRMYHLSNLQLANHFEISRTTIAKWKRMHTHNIL